MKKIMAFMLLALVCTTASAQITQKDKDDFFGKEDKDDFFGKGTKEDFFSNNDPGFAAERQKMYENYNKFRKEALKNYSDFVRKAWKDYKANAAIDAPKDEMIKPQMAPDSEERTASWFIKIFGKEKKKDTKKTKPKSKAAERKPEVLKVETVIKAEPVIPQPEPQIPAEPRVEKANNYMTFSVFGTECKVRIGENCRYKLPNASTAAVADAIENVFPGQQFENLLYDCLQERKRHDFSDWAYYQMLLALTRQFYGDTNEAVLCQAFLYSQSGYKMRLAHTSQKLYMLAATRHFIFNKQFYVLNGENYFLLSDNKVDQLGICEASFPKESSLSLQITASQQFAENPTMQRTITSRYNEDFSFTVTSNKNYIDFFGTYPSSTVNNNFMSRPKTRSIFRSKGASSRSIRSTRRCIIKTSPLTRSTIFTRCGSSWIPNSSVIPRSASSTRCSTRSRGVSKTIFLPRSPTCTVRSIPPSSAATVFLLKCRSVLGRCTRLPNTAFARTGNINRVLRQKKNSIRSSNGSRVSLKPRTSKEIQTSL